MKDKKQILDYLTGWVARQQKLILSKGRPLTNKEKNSLSNVGIVDLDKIRVCIVDNIPLPSEKRIGQVLGTDVIGLCLNHGIYIKKGTKDILSILRHELTHTFQYYRHGGIRNFLTEYVDQHMKYGYNAMPFEKEARNNEKN